MGVRGGGAPSENEKKNLQIYSTNNMPQHIIIGKCCNKSNAVVYDVVEDVNNLITDLDLTECVDDDGECGENVCKFCAHSFIFSELDDLKVRIFEIDKHNYSKYIDGVAPCVCHPLVFIVEKDSRPICEITREIDGMWP